jgi:hypothetical protein
MYTRNDYLEKRCSHREYYGQFVSAAILRTVRVSVGEYRIKNSTDPHFNDIPLSIWDNVLTLAPCYLTKAMREAGDNPTLAGLVCVAKEAARQIRGD